MNSWNFDTHVDPELVLIVEISQFLFYFCLFWVWSAPYWQFFIINYEAQHMVDWFMDKKLVNMYSFDDIFWLFQIALTGIREKIVVKVPVCLRVPQGYPIGHPRGLWCDYEVIHVFTKAYVKISIGKNFRFD